MASYQYIYVMKGVSKIYPGGKEVLKNIHLSFFPGAKIGVLGLNGAGKSTLMKVMAGLDNDINGEAWPAEGVKVGYLPQEPPLAPDQDVLGQGRAVVAEPPGLQGHLEAGSARSEWPMMMVFEGSTSGRSARKSVARRASSTKAW